jgi:DNA-binding Lrp family transcriptional regulator
MNENARWPSVDSLDLAILAGFAREPRATYGEMGTRVGLSGNAIKSRLQRLEQLGVLQGFAAVPDPTLLGLREGLLVFLGVEDLDEREEEILRSLPDVPGVAFLDVALDHAVYVWTLHKDEADADRVERAAISLLGKPPAFRYEGRAEPESAPTPPIHPVALTAADWRVARALLPDARRSAKELARTSGTTFKTLKRRMARLLDSGNMRVEPVLSGTQAPGGVLFRLVAIAKPGERPIAFPEDAIVTRFDGSRIAVAEMRRETPHAAQEVFRAARADPAIERCFLQIATRRRSAGWLEESLLARASAPPEAVAPRAAPVPLQRRVQR